MPVHVSEGRVCKPMSGEQAVYIRSPCHLCLGSKDNLSETMIENNIGSMHAQLAMDD